MSDFLTETAVGISTDSNGFTCIESLAWDTIIKITIALMITEIVVGIAFLCIRSKRHRVDHEHGMVHAYKGVSSSGDFICLEQWLVITICITVSLLICALFTFITLSIREIWLLKQSRRGKDNEEDEKEQLMEIADEVGVSHKKMES
ncbi:hypothetical protein I308_104624 [Cryptococcus tetragattii IND107]|uniref:Uncharacterized protein n=1 Tax=Cryptococcus tetragattii IND107 TaxID=1296105 RepID=A0ABR3BN56_9TREE